ncbi:uncharacterized protein LOC108665627 [Hyalella azteca]|uniref:Uncharacterized protein LOC108665627 n=1 Tax=Hyalella azteca TaxID=294128 RepID=A0A8B7N3A9_HYAAZ|nr:uncharacterized protein LOC108665627 [Hyalella azteca]
MASAGGGPSNSNTSNLRRQNSISPLEQSLNMVNPPPSIAPVTIYPGPGARHANMAKADLEIVQRLHQLRGSSTAPTEDEMCERLAKLKGLPADYYSKPSPGHPALASDNRSDAQKAQDLLSQAMEEVRLESIHSGSTDVDLEQRLARLRNQDLTGASAKPLPPTLESPSLPVGLDDAQELRALLDEASASASAEAAAAMRSLERDPALCDVVARLMREKPSARKSRHSRPTTAGEGGSSSDDDARYSDSSDSSPRPPARLRKVGESLDKSADIKKSADQINFDYDEEVSQIVNMYTTQAAEKKKKRRMKKKKNLDPSAKTGTGKNKSDAKETRTDSSSELLTESDLEKSSDSEKLSASSE